MKLFPTRNNCFCWAHLAENKVLECLRYKLDRWRNSHVLVYHGPLLSDLVPPTFTTVYLKKTFNILGEIWEILLDCPDFEDASKGFWSFLSSQPYRPWRQKIPPYPTREHTNFQPTLQQLENCGIPLQNMHLITFIHEFMVHFSAMTISGYFWSVRSSKMDRLHSCYTPWKKNVLFHPRPNKKHIL